MLALACSTLGGIGPARAAAGPWQGSEAIRARLVSGVEAVGTLDVIPMAIEIRLTPPWKTYWRTSGDSGVPPRFNWDGSENLDHAEPRFPAPHRFELFDIQTFGYGGKLVLPVDWHVASPGASVAARLDLRILICDEICIPERLDLALDLPAGDAVPGFHRFMIAEAEEAVPVPAADSELALERIVLVPGADGRPGIRAIVSAPEELQAPDIFIESTPYLPLSAPRVALSEDGRRAQLDFRFDGALPIGFSPEEGLDIRATVTAGDAAMQTETRLTYDAAAPAAAPAAGAGSGKQEPRIFGLGLDVISGLAFFALGCGVFFVLTLRPR